LKKLLPLALGVSLFLPGCGSASYDDVSDEELAAATDAYNELVEDYYGGPTYSKKEFEHEAKRVCDLLPHDTTEEDFDNAADTVYGETENMHGMGAVALVSHGARSFCKDKHASAFPEYLD